MQVLTDSAQLAAVLSPLRMRVLEAMKEPQSATSLAPRLGLTRQKLNYHLRELEREGLLQVVEERQRRGCVERVLQVTSRAFVVDPAVLGPLADDPDLARDRFSSAHLVATATALIRDVAVLRERARSVDQRLATFTLDCEIAFESPAAFRSFVDEMTAAVARLATKYNQPKRTHDDRTRSPQSPQSHDISARSASSAFNRGRKARRFHLVVGAHPVVTKSLAEASAEAAAHRRSSHSHRRNVARRTS